MWSKMYVGLHIMYRLFLSYFNETNSFGRFSKNTQLQIFMKICRLGAELLHTDRRTGVTKLIVAFRNFANAPAIGCVPFFACVFI